MPKILFLISFLFLSISIFSQQDLPNYMTDAEKTQLKDYIKNLKSKGSVNPPSSPVRTPAEWEEMQAIVISWKSYTSVLTQIVEEAVEECEVYIVTTDSGGVKTSLQNSNISLANVSFIDAYANSVWIRDYGPNVIYTNDVDSLLIVDWIYNRPRPYDDAVPSVVANKLGLPFYELVNSPNDLVGTGGNFFTDGFGTAFSSELIVDENGPNNNFGVSAKTQDDIDTILKNYMGIEEYIIFPTLPYDGIHHIDMHMKLLDEETILVAEYPQNVADGPYIESNLQYLLNNYTSMFGDKYKVVRIPSPPDEYNRYPDNNGYYRTYTNSLIINGKVLMPAYELEYDTTAIRIYQQAMPGYEIVPIDCNSPIHASGAIHCITHEVAAENPVLISHQEFKDTNDVSNPYQIDAKIINKSGIASATLYYKTSLTANYQAVAMSLTNSQNNIWSADIPAQQFGTRVYYYIEASSNNAKTITRPIPAPDAYFTFKVFDPNSINEINANDIEMSFYNSGNNLVVDVNAEFEFCGNIELIDLLGRIYNLKADYNFDKGLNKIKINNQNFERGIYIFRITTDKSYKTIKVLID